MQLWTIFVVAGLVFLILEMIVPTMFFLNFAVAGLITAILAMFITNWVHLVLIFVALSLISIVFLRPILIRHKDSKENRTGMEDKYIGKIVKVKEQVKRLIDAGILIQTDSASRNRTFSYKEYLDILRDGT